jgi:hypothetical protein
MIERCRTYQGAHIPGCIGCAVGGHARCTCPSSADERRDHDHRLEALEHRLTKLEQAVYRKDAVP